MKILNLILASALLILGAQAQASECDVCNRMKSLSQSKGNAEQLKELLQKVYPIIAEFEFDKTGNKGLLRQQAEAVTDMSATYIPVEQKTEGTVDIMEFYHQKYTEQTTEMERARQRLDAGKQKILKRANEDMQLLERCGDGGCKQNQSQTESQNQSQAPAAPKAGQ